LEVLVVLLEDWRYFEHRGIDWRSVLREGLKAISFQKHGGASTIDMQFVRTKQVLKQEL
jgi:penicillin-binding protein 1A